MESPKATPGITSLNMLARHLPYAPSPEAKGPGTADVLTRPETPSTMRVLTGKRGPRARRQPRQGSVMARMCEVCGKKTVFGHNVSHAHNVTNRRWLPNLQRVRVKVGNGGTKRVRVCTRCLRSGKIEKAVS